MSASRRSILLVLCGVILLALVGAVALRRRGPGTASDDGAHAGPARSCESAGGDASAVIDACTAIIQADDAQVEEVERALVARALAYEQRGERANAERDRALVTLLTSP